LTPPAVRAISRFPLLFETGTAEVASKTDDMYSLRSWTFITSHAQVLLALAHNHSASVVQLAEAARITERSAYRVLADLQRAGYVRRTKAGRENRYAINYELPLHDPMVERGIVRDLLTLAAGGEPRAILSEQIAVD
jgi:DNA-binding transcriptional ArsR family regulator